MNDHDITAFRSVPPAPPAAPSARRRWPWVLAGLGLCFVIVLALAGVALVQLGHLAGSDVNLVIDDETVTLGALGAGQGLTLALGLGVALFVVAIVVPLALLLAFGAAALGLGVALFAVLLVVAVAASPALLLLALVWWAVRPRRTAPRSAAP